MKLLALDTSHNACSVAITVDGKDYSRHIIAPMQQAKLVLPTIEALLQEAGIALHELDALAFGYGPGSFTGVRIATSVMQGLAFAIQKPLIPISSLAAVAQGAWTALGWRDLMVVMDARMNEVYTGAYQVTAADVVELLGVERVQPAAAVVAPPGVEWCGVGNGWDVYAEQFSWRPVKVDVNQLPTAVAILALARLKFLRGEFTAACDVVPSYLRDNVAIKSS